MNPENGNENENEKEDVMSAQNPAPPWIAANLNDIEAVPCPCGMSRRAFTEDIDRIA